MSFLYEQSSSEKCRKEQRTLIMQEIYWRNPPRITIYLVLAKLYLKNPRKWTSKTYISMDLAQSLMASNQTVTAYKYNGRTTIILTTKHQDMVTGQVPYPLQKASLDSQYQWLQCNPFSLLDDWFSKQALQKKILNNKIQFNIFTKAKGAKQDCINSAVPSSS